MSSLALVPSSQSGTLTSPAVGKGSTLSLSGSSSSLPTLNLTPRKDEAPPKNLGTPKTTGRAPGRWIHPRVAEIIRRRNATNFDSSNVKAVAYNLALILASLYILQVLRLLLPTAWLHAIQPYPKYVVLALRLVLLTNIGFALSPLARKSDPCEDIPLAPSQRKLLGLPPMSRPATPQEQEQYITPPRFSRSGTPNSSTSSLRAETSGSPLSGRGVGFDSPFRLSNSGSPFESSFQRTGSDSPAGVRSGGDRRRLSFASNRSSPLSISEFDAIGNTSTPSKGTKASVGLNNKWLYEKGRGSPRTSLGASGRSGVYI